MAEIGTDIEKARRILIEGGLVAIPTETVYGLAANALDPGAVLKIFEAKKRPAFDPLIVHVHAQGQVLKYVYSIPEKGQILAENFWPGPLTLLTGKRAIIPDIVTSGMDQVAIRVPDNDLTLRLLSSLPFPLVAPSANPFGYISPTTAQHVNDQLGDEVDYILDGGSCRVGLESTIIGFPDSKPTIFRLGGLGISSIEDLIGHVEVTDHSTSNPKAPGMLKSHYAPRRIFRLMEQKEMNISGPSDKIGYLVFRTPLEGAKHQRVLAPDGDIHTAAKNLFGFMRELDKLPIEYIHAERVPDHGLGKAINDRLKRAAAVKD